MHLFSLLYYKKTQLFFNWFFFLLHLPSLGSLPGSLPQTPAFPILMKHLVIWCFPIWLTMSLSYPDMPTFNAKLFGLFYQTPKILALFLGLIEIFMCKKIVRQLILSNLRPAFPCSSCSFSSSLVFEFRVRSLRCDFFFHKSNYLPIIKMLLFSSRWRRLRESSKYFYEWHIGFWKWNSFLK